jgi:peptidyl-prolyl cis-trans isomerase A (cyclophilin A)
MPNSARLRGVPIFLAVSLVFAIQGCAPGRSAAPPVAPPGPTSILLSPEVLDLDPPPVFKALFETTAGDFIVEVDTDWAPLGARRFYNLVQAGYYDGVRFFRVVPGFVAQFGIHPDPQVSEAWRGARIADDSVSLSNLRGTLSFATSGPETRTVQLFINLVDNVRLDASGFSPFGRITGGMDAVDRIHGGYGEGAPRGNGPSQGRIQSEGEAYLSAEFPLLDQIIRAVILPLPDAVDR